MQIIEISLEGLSNKEGLEKLLLDNNQAMKVGKPGNERMVFSGLTILNLLEDCYAYKQQAKKGNIAIAIFRARMKKDGFRLFPREIKGKIAGMSKETGIPEKELATFLKDEIEFMTKEVLVSF